MKRGEKNQGTVPNQCAKIQNVLPYGSKACHRLLWHKNNNNNTYNNNRFPPDGGTLIIPTITIGFLLTEEPAIAACSYICMYYYYSCAIDFNSTRIIIIPTNIAAGSN